MIYISEILRKLKIMILALHITLMMDAAKSEEIVHLMCVGSHHHQNYNRPGMICLLKVLICKVSRLFAIKMK
jgi:hypothetical protein